MPHPQFPIGSGFGAATTAQAVLAGLDLSHATAIVTGGHSGLGLETTRALAQAGARVIAARDAEAARAQTRDIAGVQVEPLDLARLDSVRDFARRFLAGGQHVDMLICSAGIMACPRPASGRVGKPSSPPTTWAITRWPTCSGRRSAAARAWSPSRPPDTINPACAGTMCSSRGATTNGWPTGSRKPRTPCLPCIWTSWDESMACAPFRCIPARSSRRCNAT